MKYKVRAGCGAARLIQISFNAHAYCTCWMRGRDEVSAGHCLLCAGAAPTPFLFSRLRVANLSDLLAGVRVWLRETTLLCGCNFYLAKLSSALAVPTCILRVD